MKEIIRKVKSMFVRTPTKPFIWHPEDWETAKKYAKSQPHPENDKESLWEYAQKSPLDDSSYVLSRINEYLEKLKNQNKDE